MYEVDFFEFLPLPVTGDVTSENPLLETFQVITTKVNYFGESCLGYKQNFVPCH